MNTPPQSQPEPAAAARSLPLPRLGEGTRLTASSLGYSLSAATGGRRFNHPFEVSLGSRFAVVSRGLVDGIYEPKIGKVPMSGDAKHAAPRLELKADDVNANGESWVCLDVVPDAVAGQLTNASSIQIVHTGRPFSREALLGRCPLAMILWRSRRPLRVWPIVFFNLRYVRVMPSGNGAGFVRHLFL